MAIVYIDTDDAHKIKEGASVTFHCSHTDNFEHEYIHRKGIIVVKDGVRCFQDEYGRITPVTELVAHIKSILIEYAEFITEDNNLMNL